MQVQLKPQKHLTFVLNAMLAGAAWAGLVAMVFLFNSGQYDFWFPGRVLAYVLLLIAPTLTFVPIGRLINSPFYVYSAIICWVVFGYVFAFVPVDPELGWRENIVPMAVLLTSFFGVLVSIFLPICYTLGSKIDTNRITRYDMGRARRETFLLAGYVVLMATLRALGVLTTIYAVGIFAIVVVIELLFLSRSTNN